MPSTDKVRSFRWRLLVFAVVVLLPFVRFLLVHGYGFFNPEVACAVALFLVVCAVLALVSKKDWVFYGLLLFLIVATSLNTFYLDILPTVRLRWIASGLIVCVAGCMYLMRRNFDRILLVFAFSAFSVDVANTAIEEAQRPPLDQQTTAREGLSHVVYLILDEQIGLAGFPQDVPACLAAEGALRQVLLDYGFSVYPYAFSNYQRTWDSVPSILNDTLLEKTGYYIKSLSRRGILRSNALFESYLDRGYAISVYESDFIGFTSESPQVSRLTYNANSLATMRSLDLEWRAKLHQILTIYFQTDRVLWRSYRALVPDEYEPTIFRVGPLAMVGVWPDRVLADMRGANQDTLFFAHLLIPHYPYVYGREAPIRDPEVWKEDDNTAPLFDGARYRHRYERYCDQVVYMSGLLRRFFQQMHEVGAFERAQVIVLGDHGSRIRFRDESERQEWEKLAVDGPDCPGANRYDYVREPDLQDLLNRFSTLLAIKRPGRQDPSVVNELGSVLFFLRRELEEVRGDPSEPGLNSAYLFNADGSPHPIPLAEIWKAAAAESGR